MIDLRYTLKKVSVGGICFLYPIPVVKQHKYLIEIPPIFSDFFISAFINQYLVSPDTTPDFLVHDRIHTDGSTPVYKIDCSKLSFTLLFNRNKDTTKASTIENLLTKKIILVLLSPNDQEVKNSLVKTLEKQKLCSTCQSLGILDTKLQSFIDLLINLEAS